MGKKCMFDRLNSAVCPIDKKFSELKTLEKYELFIEWIKGNWLKQTSFILGISLFSLFCIGLYSENIGSKFDILKNLNTWVGFILGIIATLFSIISMFLSFYSLEKSKESEDAMKETLISIKETMAKTETILLREFEEIKNNNKEILSKVDKPENYNNNNSLDSGITQY